MDHAAYNRAINWSPRICKMQGLWTFFDFNGNQWPVFYKTRMEAEGVAAKHVGAVMERIRYGNRSVCPQADTAGN